MKIAFVHPDLGIGGAERLVVDAAVGLQELGHKVVVYTSYRDEKHCFPETRDGTLEVRVRGGWLFPANVFGMLSILCAMLRQVHLAITLLLDSERYDSVFADQLSFAVPLLKLRGYKVLFYCHFPDKLLSSRTSLVKSLYRLPFDLAEELTTGAADTIVVNSKYTAGVFRQAFRRIARTPAVVYPCVDVAQTFAGDALSNVGDIRIALSINRFERKKQVSLAVDAFAAMLEAMSADEASKCRLVIAGGFDSRVAENALTYDQLVQQCDRHKLPHTTISAAELSLPLDVGGLKSSARQAAQVIFLPSIPDALKRSLLHHARVLLYTPANEHFGIVPLEAALAHCPCIAQDSGGPLETIEDGVTGYLRPADPQAWANVMRKLLLEQNAGEMGNEARRRVSGRFDRQTMCKAIEAELKSLAAKPDKMKPAESSTKIASTPTTAAETQAVRPKPKLPPEYTRAPEPLEMKVVLMMTACSVGVALFCIGTMYLAHKYQLP